MVCFRFTCNNSDCESDADDDDEVQDENYDPQLPKKRKADHITITIFNLRKQKVKTF